MEVTKFDLTADKAPEGLPQSLLDFSKIVMIAVAAIHTAQRLAATVTEIRDAAGKEQEAENSVLLQGILQYTEAVNPLMLKMAEMFPSGPTSAMEFVIAHALRRGIIVVPLNPGDKVTPEIIEEMAKSYYGQAQKH